MRLILSRKGFDSTYGGNASPILPDGTLVSFPIPERGSGVRYADLQTPVGSMYELMLQLGIERYKEGGKMHPLSVSAETHLDPDLNAATRPRSEQWAPVFGQCSTAQGHLRNQGVRTGDLFLFYGTFRHAKRTGKRHVFSSEPVHVIFGYMQVGTIVRVDEKTSLPWCADHPHLVNRRRKSNTLYIAAETLHGSSCPGAGMLPYSQHRVLSAMPGLVSRWRLPSFFHPHEAGRFLTCHPDIDVWQRDGDSTFLQTKSPAQEYVIEATPQIAEWAYSMVNG